jgi:hypothetical protein
MPRDLSPRRNLDGSLTIRAHRRPVRIGRARVEMAEIFKHPILPGRCFQCGQEAMYLVSSRRGGPELVFERYRCGECDLDYEEPLD